MKIQNTTDTNKRIRLTALDSAMSNIDDSVGAIAKDGRDILLCLAPKAGISCAGAIDEINILIDKFSLMEFQTLYLNDLESEEYIISALPAYGFDSHEAVLDKLVELLEGTGLSATWSETAELQYILTLRNEGAVSRRLSFAFYQDSPILSTDIDGLPFNETSLINEDRQEVTFCLAPKGAEEQPSVTLPQLSISKATSADLADVLSVGLGTSEEHGWSDWYDSKMSDNNFPAIDHYDIVQGDVVANDSSREIVIHSYLPSGPQYGDEPRQSPWRRGQIAKWNFEEELLPLLVSIAAKAEPETIILSTNIPPYEPEEGEEEEFDPFSRVDIRAKEFLDPNAGELNWLRSENFEKLIYLIDEDLLKFTIYDSDGITSLGEYTVSVKQTCSLHYPEFDTVAAAPINVPGYVGTATGTFGFTHLETATNLNDLDEYFARVPSGYVDYPADDDFAASGLIKFANGVNVVMGSNVEFTKSAKDNMRGLEIKLYRDGRLLLDIKQPGEYYVTMMIHAATPLSIDDIEPIPGLTPNVDYHRNETLDMYAMYVTYHFKAS